MSRHHCLPILLASELRHVFLGCDHFAVCMTTSCCDFDFLVAIVLVVFLLTCLNFMSRPHGVVAMSFVSHFFSFVCNLNSTLQHISSFLPIFQVATSSWCRNLNFFRSALLQVATLMSGRDIISDP